MTVQELSQQLLAKGINPIPYNLVKGPKKWNKKPLVSWKDFQAVLMTEQTRTESFKPYTKALGIILGKLSRLESIDFETEDAWQSWLHRIELVPELLRALESCYLEATISGGRHLVYGTNEPTSQICVHGKPDRDGKKELILEIRGEGNIIVVAPSQGYKVEQGSLLTIPLLSDDIVAQFRDAAQSIGWVDVKAERIALKAKQSDVSEEQDDDAPNVAQDFNSKADIKEILGPQGWSYSHSSAGEEYWVRPGKSLADGHSGTWNGATFCNFSASVDELEIKRGYNLFQLYAVYNHAGDQSAASKALYSKGYGKHRPEVTDEMVKRGLACFTWEPEPLTIPAESAPPIPTSIELLPAPTEADIRQVIEGTPLQTFCELFPKDVPISLPLVGSLVVAGSILARRCRIGAFNADPRSRMATNVYGLLAAESRGGKGLVQRTADLIIEDIGVPKLDESSEKVFLQQLGHSPWGVLFIQEFSPYLNERGWQKSVLPKMTDAFDGRNVSSSAVSSGKCHIRNPAPSILSAVQPSAVENLGTSDLIGTGFIPRFLVGINDLREDEEWIKLTDAISDPDHRPALTAFERWTTMLPPPIDPGFETSKGQFLHPVPPYWMQPEEYSSTFKAFHIPSSARAIAITLRSKYVPIIALMFCSDADWAAHRIPAHALERAEIIAQALFWSAFKFAGFVPTGRSGQMLTRITNYLERIKEMKGRSTASVAEFCKGLSISNKREFIEALELGVMGGRLMETTVKATNGKVSQRYSLPIRPTSAPVSMPTLKTIEQPKAKPLTVPLDFKAKQANGEDWL